MHFSAFEWLLWQQENRQCKFPISQPLGEGPDWLSTTGSLCSPSLQGLRGHLSLVEETRHLLNHRLLTDSPCNPTQIAHSISFLMELAEK
jgi:hypothetical protein